MSDSLPPHGLQHTRLSCPSLSPRVCSNSCPFSWSWHITISSSVIHFSSCPQFFPESGFFPTSQLLAWGGQSIGVSASVSVLPVNIQGWFPLGLTGLILLSKGLWRVFSAPVRKHQFFGAQPSLWSNSHIPTWLLEKPWCVCVSHSVVSNSATPWTVAHQPPLSMAFSRQEYWSALPFPLQGIFPTQESNSGLLHCGQILYH